MDTAISGRWRRSASKAFGRLALGKWNGGASRATVSCRLTKQHRKPHWHRAMEHKRDSGDLVAAFALAARFAQRGSVEAQAIVAQLYVTGSGVPRNVSQAALWYRRAAEGGHEVSMVGLAKLSLDECELKTSLFGNGFDHTPGEALKWAQKAADAGSPEGKSLLAYLLCNAGGIRGTCGRDARALLEEASEVDDPSACLQLALMLCRSEPRGRPELVTSLLRRAAEAQLPLALYLVGVAEETGFGCSRDEQAALRHFRLAADLDVVSAQVRVGNAMLAGVGVPRNIVLGETLLRKGVAAGDPRAAGLMGHLRAGRDGFAPDFQEAAKWFMQAAELGDTNAARVVACMHLLGLGVVEDARAAAAWIVRAQNAVTIGFQDPAVILVEGGLGLRHRAQVQDWFLEAAASGDHLAAYRLGVCAAMGVDAAPDYDKASRWLRTASTVLPVARLRYGQLLATGRFGPVAKHLGRELVREAAAREVGDAQFVIATIPTEQVDA